MVKKQEKKYQLGKFMKLLIMVIFVLSACIDNEQEGSSSDEIPSYDPPSWQDNPSAYQFTATIQGGIVRNDGIQMGECNELNNNGACLDVVQDILAAFDSENNVRGIAIMLSPPFGPNQWTPVYEMQLRSNAAGDVLSFKYYDMSEDKILDITETHEFVIDEVMGNVVNPILLNINNSIER